MLPCRSCTSTAATTAVQLQRGIENTVWLRQLGSCTLSYGGFQWKLPPTICHENIARLRQLQCCFRYNQHSSTSKAGLTPCRPGNASNAAKPPLHTQNTPHPRFKTAAAAAAAAAPLAVHAHEDVRDVASFLLPYLAEVVIPINQKHQDDIHGAKAEITSYVPRPNPAPIG